MTKEQIYEAMNDINETYITETNSKSNRKKKNILKIGTVAACICLAVAGTAFFVNREPETFKTPNPNMLQVTNPLVEVDSLEEMNFMLDFSVPVLNKEIKSYIVIVLNGYPSIGRIYYKDGSVFSMQYGTGDISGIYGGTIEYKTEINRANVSFCSYNDTNYAIWEKDGFTYSLTDSESLDSEVNELLNK